MIHKEKNHIYKGQEIFFNNQIRILKIKIQSLKEKLKRLIKQYTRHSLKKKALWIENQKWENYSGYNPR